MSGALALGGLIWPAERLAAAIGAATGGPGLGCADDPGCRDVAPAGGNGGNVRGTEVDAVEIPWSELCRALPGLGPAVLQLGEPLSGHLVLVPGRGRGVSLLAPGGSRHECRASRLAASLRRGVEDRHAAAVEALLSTLPLARRHRRRRRAGQAVLAGLLAAEPGSRVYLLRSGARGPLTRQLSAARLGCSAAVLALALAAAQALAVWSWTLLGRGLLAGRLEPGWRLAWALLVVSLPLARAIELGATANLGQRVALVLRRRLFAALLALAPDRLRGDGTGRLLGRLLAAEALERVLLSGGPACLMALVELGVATSALALGAAATLHLALVTIALVATALLFARLARADRFCAEERRELTADLVEAMAGHRTRLAQATRQSDAREDGALAAYHSLTRQVGRHQALLRTGVARAWEVAALGALAPVVATATAPAGRLAASLGGILLARSALGRLGAGLCDAAAAHACAGEISPILAANAAAAAAAEDSTAGRRGGRVPAAAGCEPSPAAPASGGRAEDRHRVVEARTLHVQVGEPPQLVLAGASFDIRGGDRIVLDGPSGAGKSTLAAVLAAQRRPDSGLLLLGGLDLPTLGVGAWRRRVVAVPQLHVNHLFAETLAFNLLLGRGWPPAASDLADADALCHELGLGGLLERLPAGLEQRVGEAGWRLSDGEASRVCLARALLQDPELLILDESLAALDPETRLRVIEVASRRARALVVVAHPEAR